MQIYKDPMTRFREIGQNVNFGLKRAFLDLNWPKTSQTGIFWAKSENVTSVALGRPNFVPNFRKFL